MAIFHLSVKNISRGAGRSVTAAAAYRSASRIVDERTGQVHNYRRKQGVHATEILTPSVAPLWMRDRAALWNAVEQSEKRKDARLAREVDIALPAELTFAEHQQLVRHFVQEQFVRRGMIADVAYHDIQTHNPPCACAAHVTAPYRRHLREKGTGLESSPPGHHLAADVGGICKHGA